MILCKNKKAYFDYEILKEYTAGIVLSGSEVRSCRNKNIQLKGSYISIKDNFIILKGMHVSQYKNDHTDDYTPDRERFLLLEKQEIAKIEMKLKTPGLTLIPLELFTRNRLIKMKIAISQGKKQYDKRQSIKKRDLDRRKIF
jgi:SsrA-binding protein